MKILLITTNLGTDTGWGAYSANLVRAAIQTGDEVSAAVQNDTNMPEVQQYPVLEPPHTVMWHPIRLLSQAKALRKIIKAEQPDVVHVIVEPYVGVFAFFKPNTPIVLTIHGTYALYPRMLSTWSKSLFSRSFYNRALSHVTHIISVSQRTEQMFLAAINYPAASVSVVHNAISTPANLVHTHDQVTLHATIIGAVKARKGIHTAIRLLSKWAESNRRKVEYHVVGYIDNESSYSKQVKEEAQKANSTYFHTTFHGQVSEQEKKDILLKSNLYIHLEDTKNDSREVEGFGIGIIEAASYGVPSLVAEGSATSEAVKEGVSGFIVPLENESIVYDRIDKLLLEKSLKESGIINWAKLHSPEKIYEKIRQIYIKAIK